jgi:hypothetical protein
MTGTFSKPDDHLVILAPVLSQNGGIKSIPDIITINE